MCIIQQLPLLEPVGSVAFLLCGTKGAVYRCFHLSLFLLIIDVPVWNQLPFFWSVEPFFVKSNFLFSEVLSARCHPLLSDLLAPLCI